MRVQISMSVPHRGATVVTNLLKISMEQTETSAKVVDMTTLSPMMKQYYDIKSKHPDAVLLFRVGDFYESYNEDAKTCADILCITLTWRRNVRPDYKTYRGAMAGFPHHALDTYLPKLVRAGKRIAICDQLEAPKKTVKRGITELVTPMVNQ